MSCKKIIFSLSLTLGLLLCPSLVSPSLADSGSLTDNQAQQVKLIIKAYLLEHPEIIQDSIEALRVKMQAQNDLDGKKLIKAYQTELFANPQDPIGGNPQGTTSLVFFFDYNCTFCKQGTVPLNNVIKSDGNIKIIYKEYPILTQDSIYAARVALAADKQNKYDQIHQAFMKYRGKLDVATIWEIAKTTGLNVVQLKTDMNSKDIDEKLRQNLLLAKNLGINATPTMVIDDRVISGALDQDEINQLIKNSRKGKPSV